VQVDDLGRNFAMNPRSGLKIRQWKYSCALCSVSSHHLLWISLLASGVHC
jgi:hypothetical protein